MATTDLTLDLDTAFFEQLFHKAYPDFSNEMYHFAKQMVVDGVIQIETLLELAIAKVGKLKRLSVEGMDYSDKSDAKKASVRFRGNGGAYSACIQQVHTKKGNLRVMIYERQQDRFYYFVFPRESYDHIKSSSNIEIPFELDGTPRRKPKRPVYTNWWAYEVDSFEAMARSKKAIKQTLTEIGKRQREHKNKFEIVEYIG